MRNSTIPNMLPSEILDPIIWDRIGLDLYNTIIAVDTETRGLFADDGALVSTVSVAWVPYWILRDEKALDRTIATGEGVVSFAWPFAQGKNGKTEDDGQTDLFELDDPNLPEREWNALLNLLLQYPLVMHNAPFDLEKMRVGTLPRPLAGVPGWRGLDLEDNVVWDTQIVAKELDPTEPTSLKPTAERLWGVQPDNQKAIKTYLRKNHPGHPGWYDMVPWSIMEPYAAEDTELTIRLMYHQIARYSDGEGDIAGRNREFAYMRILKRMSQRGIPYAVSESLDVAAELRQRQRTIERRLPFKPTDPAAKHWFFTSENGPRWAPYSSTEQGNPQLTAEHVQRFIDEYAESDQQIDQRGVEVARLWRDWSKLETAVSMWYEPYATMTGADGRLRTYFRQTHVRSGRLSVERVNLQAIPQDYRLGDFEILNGVPTPRALIARGFDALNHDLGGKPREQEWVALEIDLAQAELRVAAQAAGCKAMLKAIEEGADLHGNAVRSMHGIDKDHPHWFPFRQAMKRGNFSLIFGVGPAKLAADIRKNTGMVMDLNEARSFVNKWNGMYPEYLRAIDKYSRMADRLHYTRLQNGRFRWYAPNEDTHKAFNQYVQGSLAEFGKDWSLWTEQYLTKRGIYQMAQRAGIGGAGLLLTIHDSQVLLVPREMAESVMNDVREYVETEATARFEVPMTCDAKPWGGAE